MSAPRVATLTAVLDEQAARAGNDIALRFLSDRGKIEAELTFAALRDKAIEAAAALAARGARPGDRALLAFPPGLEFLIAWFGCVYARVIAVPIMPPRRTGGRDASANIIADCKPRFAMTSRTFVAAIRDDMISRFAAFDLDWLMLDIGKGNAAGIDMPPPRQEDIAFLQYTSGSTANPKGVIVTHDNLVANLEMVRLAFGNDGHSTYLSWVPLHHDMGLILNVLAALYAGAPTILMSPVSFLQRPLAWLRGIGEFKAEVAGGPNFAFDHCVTRFRPEQMQGIDLRSWQVAFNAAEPVRAATMRRFAETFVPYGFDPRAFHPCYGMAEATVLISGGKRGQGAKLKLVSKAALQAQRAEDPIDGADTQTIVGCGKAAAGTEVAIVDPHAFSRLPAGQVGEIWARGQHIAQAYWLKPAESAETFGAAIGGEPDAVWLRTGDLGLMDSSGEIFVTGRIKDIIIIRGRNYYPQDIEETVQCSHPALRRGFGAAFTVTDNEGPERLVVVQEVERTERRRDDLGGIAADIREAVSDAHELAAYRVVLVTPGSVPKTTSGKIQRRLARQLWQDGTLDVILQL